MQRKRWIRPVNRRGTVAADIREGVAWCMGFGGLFSLIVIGESLVRGSDVAASVDMTLPVLIGLYLGGGLAAGVLIGLLKPYGRTRAGAALVGMCAAFPICLVAVLLMMEPGTRIGYVIVCVVGITAFGGGLAGLTIWRSNRGLDREFGN